MKKSSVEEKERHFKTQDNAMTEMLIKSNLTTFSIDGAIAFHSQLTMLEKMLYFIIHSYFTCPFSVKAFKRILEATTKENVNEIDIEQMLLNLQAAGVIHLGEDDHGSIYTIASPKFIESKQSFVIRNVFYDVSEREKNLIKVERAQNESRKNP